MQRGSEALILDRKEQRAILNLIEASIKTFTYIDTLPLPTQDREIIRELYNFISKEVRIGNIEGEVYLWMW